MYCLLIAKTVGITHFLLKSYKTTRTIKVNIRWYKEVISLRGDFFVCKSRKSLIYKGFRFFLFLCSIQCYPGKPSRISLLFALAFVVYCFETSPYYQFHTWEAGYTELWGEMRLACSGWKDSVWKISNGCKMRYPFWRYNWAKHSKNTDVSSTQYH